MFLLPVSLPATDMSGASSMSTSVDEGFLGFFFRPMNVLNLLPLLLLE